MQRGFWNFMRVMAILVSFGIMKKAIAQVEEEWRSQWEPSLGIVKDNVMVSAD